MAKKKYPKRGFASMDPAKVRAIGRLGGTASQASGAGHRWDSDEAQTAGKKGGRVSSQRRSESES